ncbi:MAG TPA: radical SAM protein [Pseudomonadales bacterium]|nr:radical SAM protein [Pseudomonadales bacterium]
MDGNIPLAPALPDFGDRRFSSAVVLVTNACNLRCKHCFVYREDTPNSPRDKMSDARMLEQLRRLRDKHGIRSMLFMGGEPMIKADLVSEAMRLFEASSIVTNGTYGIPSIPGHLVTVSLDGPRDENDAIRGKGVFDQVKKSVFDRDPNDGTEVMLQMSVTRQNADAIERFVETVKDWPISGIAFSFYVPDLGEDSEYSWSNLRERDKAIRRIIELKARYPIIKSNVGALELMLSKHCLDVTGEVGEYCNLKRMLPLYVGDGGEFERTYCCYGNNVDCSRCGSYPVFNSAWHERQQEPRESDHG